ncbi:MAG TPA: glyoxalase [Rhodobacteraceae bacterium]|nr:glyoxalase [Paracoccaceae bacterium]
MARTKVTGVGGFFFRARDPKALATWYDTHLGINPAPTDMDTPVWMQAAGPTVFAPFAADTDYFAADRPFMLNFRVSDLDAMLTELRAAGIEVSDEQAMDGIGRFARIHDPEGNPIELWQPLD